MTHLLSFKELDRVEQRDKNLVFGYVRQIKNEQMIPNLVLFTVLSFWYLAEYFAETGDDIQISDDKMKIAKIIGNGNWRNTTYGKLWFNSMEKMIHKWTFKVKMKSDVIFGFAAECIHHNEDYTACDTIINYGRAGAGGIWENGRWVVNAYNPITANSTLIVILDLINAIVIHDIDGKMELIHRDIVQNENIQYKLAISMLEKGAVITLIDYRCDKNVEYDISKLQNPHRTH